MTYCLGAGGAYTAKFATVVVVSAMVAFRAWSAAPSNAVKAWLAEVTDTVT